MNRAGISWSVSILCRAEDTPWRLDAERAASEAFLNQGADIGEVSVHGGGAPIAGDMRCVRARSLAALEVAVGGRSATLAGLHGVAVHAHAHGAARLDPLESGLLEDPIEPLASACCFTREEPGETRRGTLALRPEALWREHAGPRSAVGARTNEHVVDAEICEPLARLEIHIGQRMRAFLCSALPKIRIMNQVRRCRGDRRRVLGADTPGNDVARSRMHDDAISRSNCAPSSVRSRSPSSGADSKSSRAAPEGTVTQLRDRRLVGGYHTATRAHLDREKCIG